MSKYLLEVNYNAKGVAGVMKEGGVGRRDMVEKLLANMGGTLESFHFAFGERDAYVVAEVPSNVDAAAISMAVGSAGAATCNTVVLLTPEEIDQASQRMVEYRAPGA
jgi:uncharacterized protein with GYD domain